MLLRFISIFVIIEVVKVFAIGDKVSVLIDRPGYGTYKGMLGKKGVILNFDSVDGMYFIAEVEFVGGKIRTWVEPEDIELTSLYESKLLKVLRE